MTALANSQRQPPVSLMPLTPLKPCKQRLNQQCRLTCLPGVGLCPLKTYIHCSPSTRNGVCADDHAKMRSLRGRTLSQDNWYPDEKRGAEPRENPVMREAGTGERLPQARDHQKLSMTPETNKGMAQMSLEMEQSIHCSLVSGFLPPEL